MQPVCIETPIAGWSFTVTRFSIFVFVVMAERQESVQKVTIKKNRQENRPGEKITIKIYCRRKNRDIILKTVDNVKKTQYNHIMKRIERWWPYVDGIFRKQLSLFL